MYTKWLLPLQSGGCVRRALIVEAEWPDSGMPIGSCREDTLVRKKEALCQTRREVDASSKRLPFYRGRRAEAVHLYICQCELELGRW